MCVFNNLPKFYKRSMKYILNCKNDETMVGKWLKYKNLKPEELSELGFLKLELKGAENFYSYNLDSYNKKRNWNSPEGWANPDNFDKYRW